MKAKKFRIICFSVAAVLLALVIALAAVISVPMIRDLLDKFVVGYKDGANSGAARAEGAKLSQQIQEEGTVLVQNNDNVLPLNKSAVAQVNVFGWSAVDWVFSGSGSGQVKRGGATNFLDALKEYGVNYNESLITMYKNFRPNREFSIGGSHAGGAAEANPGGSGSLHSFNYQFSRLYEPAMSAYDSALLNDAKLYSDTAIVVIGRVSGESNDSPKVQYKKGSGKNADANKPSASETDETRTYLEISTEEEELLTYVGKEYKNVIVLINSTNVMELGFMETIPGLDSCLVVATTGSAGAKAIPRILYGEVNPSGRLADTYAYDLSTSATYVDTGSGNETTNFYTNGKGLYPTTVKHTNGNPASVDYEGVAYTDYREGVYVGYKWYETADAMGFWTSDFAKTNWKKPDGSASVNGYGDVVQYPFGYGMAFEGTKFTWDITYLNMPDGYTLSKDNISKDETIKVGVTVTNIGTVAGQDVVELYATAPYTAGGIEKSSVNLVAFGKTKQILEPGKDEYVELEFNVSDLASYDYQEKKITGGGYVLEKGDYKLSLRTDAHTVATDKMVTSDKSAFNGDTLTYKVSSDTKCMDEAKNLFTGENTKDGVAIDGNSDGSAEITYLSRNNFANTFPIKLGENRAMTDDIKALNLYTKAMADAWEARNSDAEAVTFGNGEKMLVFEGGKINDLGKQLGLDYDDPQWDELLNHITRAEMSNIIRNGYTTTAKIDSIGKPATVDFDGPNQIGSFAGSISEKATGFSSIVLAQTWNPELAYSMGLAFGTECISYGVQGWYGPGINIHRSPFGGRNYEYYSEDALISGIMCAKVVSAAKNKGVFCWLKHLCLYETESGRDGMYTWVTEQALREIYLKPFEIAVKDGGSSAIMTSYGRIGAVWTGGSETLLNDLVTDEWGFKGAFLTDYSDHVDFMDPDAMLRAGGDLFMRVGGGSFDYDNTSSNAINQALRSSTKDLVYMWLNALATNDAYNADADDVVIPTSPEMNFRWYIPVVVIVEIALAAGAGVLVFLGLKKKDPEAKAEVAESSDGDSPANE